MGFTAERKSETGTGDVAVLRLYVGIVYGPQEIIALCSVITAYQR
jgi:hypothetical protein